MTADEYRRVRRSIGLTQHELADRIGRHPSIVSKRERGLKPVTREAELAILHLRDHLERVEAFR